MLNEMADSRPRRNPNNLSVTPTASSALLSPAVMSATSAIFLSPTVASRRVLLSTSPPPSPNLPSLIPRHGKKVQSPSHNRLVARLLLTCCGVAVLLWLMLRQIYDLQPRDFLEEDDRKWDMVKGSAPSEEPSAIILQNAQGENRWTVSIPPSSDFPLKPSQYRHVCQQAMEVSKQLRAEARASGIATHMLSYYQIDKIYIDVAEAEQQALLPSSTSSGRPAGFVDDVAVANKEYVGRMDVCDRTLTYVMETGDAGFGNTLLRMWMSYGLAQAENRTFFVHDSRWPYGKYSTFFMPPPTAGCLPPPRAHMVPCPHQARHLVVSGATVQSTFGHAFTDEWEDARKHYVQRQHKIFGLLRTGYEALFRLREDDAAYVLDRAKSLFGPLTREGGTSIGIHVRHGDKHPWEFQYQKDYLPLDRYLNTARDVSLDRAQRANTDSWKKRSHEEKKNVTYELFMAPPTLVLATDDPMVYESEELGAATVRAQDRIILATKAALEAAQGKPNPWIDEITGWEGGFYRDFFFSLGLSAEHAHDARTTVSDAKVPEAAMKLRELVGRAYLLDLAVLAQADAVVCAVSSVACRVLAVMMGWDSAVTQKNWINVDGDFDWKGIMW